MVGTRCSPACSTALKPHAVQGLDRRSRHRSERLLLPCPSPQSPPPLSLHLPLQLVEEAPVAALGTDLLRADLNHPHLVEAEGVEAHGILMVVLAPLVVGDLLQRMEGVVVTLRGALLYQEA